jgi:catechol 2,3-dioxygenase-like lactoylglutathione lyase family enzyme
LSEASYCGLFAVPGTEIGDESLVR